MPHRILIGLLPKNHPWRSLPLKDVPGIMAFECRSRRYVPIALFSALTFAAVPAGFLARYVLTCDAPS